MPSNAKLFRKIFKSLGIFVLGLNLSFASIPRCAALFSLYQAVVSAEGTADEATPSCHEEASQSSQPTDGAVLQNDLFCKCSLLSGLLFTMPTFEPDFLVGFVPQSERLLTFDYEDRSAEFLVEVEPPYPKA